MDFIRNNMIEKHYKIVELKYHNIINYTETEKEHKEKMQKF